jgi:hypothetical protein
LEWLTEHLWHPVKRLLVNFIQVFLSVASLWSLRVQTALNIKACLANLITAVQLIKAALISAQVKVLLIGSQLVTTARQISQRVATVLLQKKDRLVVLIKLALSHLKMSKTALIRMARLLHQVGLKLQEVVKQHLQPAVLLQHWEQVRVALTKMVLLIIKKPVAVLTRMASLLKGNGWKHQEAVKPRRPRATTRSKRSKKLVE